MGPEGARRPLSEDFLLRGQWYSDGYFPDGWCENAGVDDEERSLELRSMHIPRMERILWLGQKIAARGNWITFDIEKNRFATTEAAKGLQARQVTTPLSPHPPPPEQGPFESLNPKEPGSPSSDAPSSSTISLNPPSAEISTSAYTKESMASPTPRLPKQEDVEMSDVPTPDGNPMTLIGHNK
jgi:hypothetical protein